MLSSQLSREVRQETPNQRNGHTIRPSSLPSLTTSLPDLTQSSSSQSIAQYAINNALYDIQEIQCCDPCGASSIPLWLVGFVIVLKDWLATLNNTTSPHLTILTHCNSTDCA